MKHVYLAFLICVFGLSAYAHTYPIQFQRLAPESSVPRVLRFAEQQGVPFSQFETWLRTEYKMQSGLGWNEIKTENDQIGMVHHRWQQTWYGLPIVGADIVVHVKGNLVVSFNGLAFSNFHASLPGKQAIQDDPQLKDAAIKYFGEPEHWDIGGLPVFAPKDGQFNADAYRFAYSFQATNNTIKKGEKFFIEYPSFQVLWSYPTLCEMDSAGKGKTGFRGTKNIVTDYVNSTQKFRTLNNAQNFEIRNKNAGSTPFLNDSNHWVKSNLDSFALDAHWATDQTWKFYKNWHGRNSLNNNGFKLICIVHDGNYINAFWNGTYAAFGDGNVLSGGSVYPLVSLDVVGHEFAHGFTQYTCGLVYAYEPGALNESLSDIMGKAIEWYADSTSGKFTWNLPDDIGMTFRDMKNPNTRSMPKYYKGLYWYTGPGDNGGVHYNSSLFNYWFYLLADGDSGTNEKGYKFKVDSIGFFKASSLAYRLQAYYLTSTSQYPDAGDYAWMAAADLFGYCSKEYKAVLEALTTIGLFPQVGSGGFVETGNNTNYLIGGGKDQVIYQVRVHQDCFPNQTDTLKEIYLNFNGSTKLSDLSNIRVYYTSGIPRFSSNNLFGSAAFNNGRYIVKGSQVLSLGINRFWVVADVASGANGGNIIDGGCDSVVKNQVTVKPYVVNPDGYRIIVACKPNHVRNCSTSLKPTRVIFSGQNMVMDTLCRLNDSGYRVSFVPIQIEKGSSHKIQVDYVNSALAKAALYIDWNKNGSFADNGELMWTNSTTSPITGNISFSSNLPLGQFISRLILAPSTAIIQPCNAGAGYETWDFHTVIGPDVTINPTRICLGNTFTASATLDTTLNYQWFLNGSLISNKSGTQGGQQIQYTPTQTGALKLQLKSTQFNGNTVWSKEYKVLTFDTLPIMTLFPGSNVNVCSQDPAVLWIDSSIYRPTIQKIQITYDATSGQSMLNGLSKLYMHAGITDTNIAGSTWKYTTGNWGKDDQIGKMIRRTNNVWEFNFNPLEYFSPDLGSELKYMSIIFRDSSGQLTGKDGNGKEIYIDLRTLKSNFSGVKVKMIQHYDWYRNGQLIVKDGLPQLTTDSAGLYQVYIHNTLCHKNSLTAQVQWYPSNHPGSFASNQGVCLGDSFSLTTQQSQGQLQLQTFDSVQNKWIDAGSMSIYPTQNTWCRVKASSLTCPDSLSLPFQLKVSTPFNASALNKLKDSICVGQAVKAEYGSAYDAIVWEINNGSGWTSTQNTGSIFEPTLQNQVQIRAKVMQGFCASYTDSVAFHAFESPKAGQMQLSQTRVCLGDSLLLSMTGHKGNVQWQYFNQSTNQWQDLAGQGDQWYYSPTQQNLIRGKVTNYGCPNVEYSNTASYSLQLPPKADTLVNSKIQICQGDSAFVGWVPRQTQSFEWIKDGVPMGEKSKSELYIQTAGTYWIHMKNANGCESSSQKVTVDVLSYPAKPQILRSWNFIYVDSSLSGLTPEWTLNGVNLNHPWFGIAPSKEGLYKISVKNIGQCASSNDIQFQWSGIENDPEAHFRIFPNPCSDQFTLEGQGTFTRVEIYNVAGQKVGEWPWMSGMIISMENAPTGLYQVVLKTADGMQMSKTLNLMH